MRKLPLRYAIAIGLTYTHKQNTTRFITHLGIPTTDHYAFRRVKRLRRNFYVNRPNPNKNYIGLKDFRHMYFFIRKAYSPYHRAIYPYIQQHIRDGSGQVYRPYNPYAKFYKN